MDGPSVGSDDLDLPDECQTCNQAPGSPHRLVLETAEESKTLDIVLCDACARELAAEEWIDVVPA